MEPVIKYISIRNSDASETVAAEQIGADLYKLVENPVFSCKINYGTTIRAEARGDELVMTTIVRASEFATRQFLLNASVADISLAERFGDPILKAGGMWEVVFGGVVFVHLPRGTELNLDKLFKYAGFYSTQIVDDPESGA